jgi:GT2 family glycosyltransferase
MQNTAVVILNYNGLNWLSKFLPNVYLHSKSDANIVVIDNGSTDKSIAFIESKFKEIQLIKLPKNLGFAEGYNKGVENLKHDFFILLNSDVEVTPNWIAPIIQFFETDSNIAAIQPKILSQFDKEKFEYAGAAGGYIDKFGFPFCRGRVFDSIEKDNQQYNNIEEVFWASGACLFVRAVDFFENNGFDSSFFAHMEEIDLCWRLQNKGKKIIFNPSSTVYHVGGGTLTYDNPKKTYLNFRNSLFMLHKNDSRNLFFIISCRLLIDGIAGIRFLLKGQIKHFASVVKAHLHYYLHLKNVNDFRRTSTRIQIRSLNGFVNKLIFWKYFIQQKKTFTEIIID